MLAVVAEKTGYPPDMLDLDLDLEADLGVDTVKQAEMFAAVREAYDIPRDDKLKLRDFPTLDHVIRFVHDRAPTSTAGRGRRRQPAAPRTLGGAGEPRPEASAGLDACETVPRRVPVPVLRPPLELCRPTAVTLTQARRVVVMPDRGGVAKRSSGSSRTGVEPLVLDDASDIDESSPSSQAWTADGPVGGVYWLPALDVEPRSRDLDLAGWREGLRVRVKLLAATMRALYEQVSGPGTFLVSATRLGGRHGYDAAGATAPMGGAVTGFTKAYKRERPDCLVKAVDFEAGADAAQGRGAARRRDAGATPARSRSAAGGLRWIGRPRGGGRRRRRPGWPSAPTRSSSSPERPAASSRRSSPTWPPPRGGTFHLLDLVPEPDPANPDLDRFVTDKEGLKRDLFQRIKDRGERATPALVERELAGSSGPGPPWTPWRRCERPAGRPSTTSVDLRDPAAVAAVIDAIRRRNGRIDVLLHAAGLEISRSLARQAGPGVRPGLRRQGRRLVQPAARDRRHAARRHRGASARSPAGSATAARPTTAPPTTCCARRSRASAPPGPARAASPSTGRRGPTSAWPPAARSRR